MKRLAIAVILTVCAVSAGYGQGLLSIGPIISDKEKIPFSFTLSSSLGWDSNVSTSSSGSDAVDPLTGEAPSSNQGSWYWENGISIRYPLGGRGRNRLNLGLDYSNIWYFDPPPGSKEFTHNGKFSVDFFRQVSRRLSVADTLYLSYQTEPDFAVGASVNRQTNGYFYGFNNLSVSYAWSRRFSTVGSYSISDIWYDDGSSGDVSKSTTTSTAPPPPPTVTSTTSGATAAPAPAPAPPSSPSRQAQSQNEDYIEQTFSQQFRYALTRRTTGSLDYRFQFTIYPDNPEAESQSHFLLAGVDHSFGRQVTASVNGGAEFRSYDGFLGNRSAPYSEGSVTYRPKRSTSLRWYHRLGMEDTGSAGTQSGFSYRTGLSLAQQLTPRLAFTLSLNYIHTKFSDSPDDLEDRNEDTFDGGVGLSYHLWRNLGLSANYDYSTVSSSDGQDDYDRHRLSFGVTATF